MMLDETQRKQLEAAGVDAKDLGDLLGLMVKLVPFGKPSFELVFFAYLLRRIKRIEARLATAGTYDSAALLNEKNP